MGYSRQEYWSRLPFPPPDYLPKPGIKPTLPASSVFQVDLYRLATVEARHKLPRSKQK